MPRKSSTNKSSEAGDAPLTNRAKQRIDTRNQVYEAAIAEFTKSGIANTQIEAIVSRAGVSVGTFYRYFTSRDDVLRELQRRNAALIIERMDKIRKSVDLATYLRQLLTILLVDAPPTDLVLERDALATLVKNPPEQDSIEVHPIYGTVIAKIREGQEAGAFRTDIPATILGKLFFQHAFGIAAGTLHGNRPEAELEALVEVYLQGIRNLQTPTSPATKERGSKRKE
jgi:TetR/AcrR family transcriptional regulator, repressor for uid operon